ncbi:MAG: polysaccharide deacetylase family protein [archaeon]
MSNIKLSFGYDTERPYGQLALTPEGEAFRTRQVKIVRDLIKTFDFEGVPRTFFILGQYLERCQPQFSAERLRDIFSPEKHPLNDVQQHSYSHPIFRKIPAKPNNVPVTTAEFLKDLEKANQIIGEILGVKPTGLRTPLGYHCDLSDMPELVNGLVHMGFDFVSSDLRSIDSIDAKLRADRQPHTYEHIGQPGIVEIPSSGWQDVIFTPEKSKFYLDGRTFSTDDIVDHYTALFSQAKRMARSMPEGKTVYVSLCMHPWAVMEYDPKLEAHKRIINTARTKGIEIVPYREIADAILKRG